MTLYSKLSISNKDPLPAKPWGDDVLDATKEGPTCVQYDSLQYPPIIKGQEDCLALNIYTPSVSNTFKWCSSFLSWFDRVFAAE